ncbi:hypothetical protein C8J57DRAFT_1249952 [Mycena rebaudengoi]|nr:hypothetical protein C8J57DRAFT_1249952 [Mycena rebaudengoi]
MSCLAAFPVPRSSSPKQHPRTKLQSELRCCAALNALSRMEMVCTESYAVRDSCARGRAASVGGAERGAAPLSLRIAAGGRTLTQQAVDGQEAVARFGGARSRRRPWFGEGRFGWTENQVQANMVVRQPHTISKNVRLDGLSQELGASRGRITSTTDDKCDISGISRKRSSEMRWTEQDGGSEASHS